MTISTSIAGKDVLVTGGAGFIGSHLVDAIHDVANVRVLDDFSEGSRERLPDSIRLLEGDVRKSDTVASAMEQVDVVFHLAAMVSVTDSIEQPIECDERNVDGSLTVLEEARRQDARVVLASSAAVYGPQDELPITESNPTRPQSPYGIGKLAVDCYGRRYNDLYDLDTVTLRFFNVYGPGQSGGQYAGVIEVFRRQSARGEPLTVHGDGSQTRDFVHVSDVVDALLTAAETNETGEAFNVGTGNAITIDDLAHVVTRASSNAGPIRYVEARSGDIRHSVADVTKASERLGFETTMPVEVGVPRLVRDEERHESDT